MWPLHDRFKMLRQLLPTWVQMRLARFAVPKNELQNFKQYYTRARRSFQTLRPKLLALGVVLRKQQEGKDEESLLRSARKEVRTFKPALEFLQQYHGTLEMDPSVRGIHAKVIQLMTLFALGRLEEADFWKKQEDLLSKSYQTIELASAQSDLRNVVPLDIRQFLPSNLIVTVDETGYIREVTDRFVNEQETMKVKRERQKELLLRYNEIVEAVRKDMQSPNPRTRLAAIITSIVMETGIRPGQERNKIKVHVGDADVEVQTFGATTLKAEHIQFVEDNFAHLEFVGKAGTTNKADITDPVTLKALHQFISQAKKDKGEGDGESPYLFVTKDGKRFNYARLNRYFKQQTALRGLKITDFRKLKATQTVLGNLQAAQEELYGRIRKFVAEESDNLRDRVVKAVQEVVEAAFLKAQVALSHEDVATTIKSYVNPEVLLRYLSRGSASRHLESVLLLGEDKLVLDVDKFIANATGSGGMGKKSSKGAEKGTLGGLLQELEQDLEGAVQSRTATGGRQSSLRGNLIRVAYHNPETRSDLLPLLRLAAQDVTESLLREAQSAFTLRSMKPAIQQALLGKPPKGTPTPGEQKVFSKLQDGQELGP